MSVNLANVAREKGIRYFLISFTDLFGVVRSKLVPAAAIEGMQKNGA
ncbi:MAG: type III glutamate--ammonia ligase, partial [Candidatus Lambdaproteobacteria bacterium]